MEKIKMSAMVNPSLSLTTTRGLRWAGGTMLAAVWRFIRIQRDRRQLHELPDYLLRDVGITRFEINSITWFAGRDTSTRSGVFEREGGGHPMTYRRSASR
ncbi:DUF1127 domain-containing protein [Mesorhizobium sp. M1307]|uniref:DUF1127 domain-containing protein n=2 Tax=unclassified Mesorhizobium TaxID=325217 RepID=UPI0009FE7839